MAQYQALSDETQVLGASLAGCLQGLITAGFSMDATGDLLRRAGLGAIDPEGWYPQQPYLDLLKEVERTHGEEALRRMAAQVPDTSRFPPGIRSLEEALQGLDIAYQLNHRGGPIGHYGCMPLGPHDLALECENPYGCAFDLGILDALIAAFKPRGARVTLVHQPGSGCRRMGDEACLYRITW